MIPTAINSGLECYRDISSFFAVNDKPNPSLSSNKYTNLMMLGVPDLPSIENGIGYLIFMRECLQTISSLSSSICHHRSFKMHFLEISIYITIL